MAASEHSGAPPCVWVGACAVDVATGQMLLGQWLDDEMRSQVGGGLGAQVPGGVWVGGAAPRGRLGVRPQLGPAA